MKALVLCFVVAVWLQMPSGGHAECCKRHSFSVRAQDGRWHTGQLCGDCSMGTPYCSYQGCNMFGCNCDGGCRTGQCDGARFAHQKRSLSASDVREQERVMRALVALDGGGDKFLSEREDDANRK